MMVIWKDSLYQQAGLISYNASIVVGALNMIEDWTSEVVLVLVEKTKTQT